MEFLANDLKKLNQPDKKRDKHAQGGDGDVVVDFSKGVLNAQSYALSMNAPSKVSNKLMPAAKRMGKESMPTTLTLIALLERAKSAISLAVSKPSPKRKPTG